MATKRNLYSIPTLILALSLIVLGCSKDGNTTTGPDGGGNVNTPSTPVPDELIGTWFTGTIGFTNFYNPTTGSWNNSRGLGMFYTLNANGTFEYGWSGEIYNYGCSTKGMIYRRGTVVVSDSVVTLYDNDGRARGEYTCAPASNFDRPDPLKVRPIIVSRSQDELGNPVLLIRGENEAFVPYKRIE